MGTTSIPESPSVSRQTIFPRTKNRIPDATTPSILRGWLEGPRLARLCACVEEIQEPLRALGLLAKAAIGLVSRKIAFFAYYEYDQERNIPHLLPIFPLSENPSRAFRVWKVSIPRKSELALVSCL